MKQSISHTILTGHSALDFYKLHTASQQFSGYSPDKQSLLKNIGGYWYKSGVFVAFDFTNGEEVFLEEFNDPLEAEKYASGILAKTKQGNLI